MKRNGRLRRRTSLKPDLETVQAFMRRGRESSARSLEASSRRATRRRIDEKPRLPINPFETDCWLKRFDPEHPCSGPVLRCHLIREQWLRDRLGLDVIERWHQDFWIPGCDGFAGVGGHHWRLDKGLIVIERRFLPTRLERRADQDSRIAHKLDSLYGERETIGRAA